MHELRRESRGATLLRLPAISPVPIPLPSTEQPFLEGMTRAGLPDVSSEAMPQLNTADELEALRRQARDEGFECGRGEGDAAGRTAYETRIERLGELAASVKRQRDDMLYALEDDIAALAFEAVVSLIGENAVDRRVLQARVGQVVSDHIGAEPVALRVAPEDVDAVAAALSRETDPLGLRVVSDASISIGGCVIELQSEHLDYRLGLQLSKLRDIFLGVRAAADRRDMAGSGTECEAQAP